MLHHVPDDLWGGEEGSLDKTPERKELGCTETIQKLKRNGTHTLLQKPASQQKRLPLPFFSLSSALLNVLQLCNPLGALGYTAPSTIPKADGIPFTHSSKPCQQGKASEGQAALSSFSWS